MDRKIRHDPAFKNLIQDFPEATLEWLLPDAIGTYGKVISVDFPRQEMKKHWLSDKGRELDIPIRYTFKNDTILVVLIEHQHDKEAFSIFKLAHYTLDLMEMFPALPIVPVVIFADPAKWRKDVQLEIRSSFLGELWLYFKFQKVKLKDIPAARAMAGDNPVLHILAPQLEYARSEKLQLIFDAYVKTFRELTPRQFQKYMDMIDNYAKLTPEEQQELLNNFIGKSEDPQMDTIRETILKEGRQTGRVSGKQDTLILQIKTKFGRISKANEKAIRGFASVRKLDALLKALITAESINDLKL